MTVLEIPTPDPRTLDDGARHFAEAVADRYAIKREIGRGGMGVVYLARDRRLDRHVAIKTLLPQFAADAMLRERFVREARAAGGMAHPGIVPIHEAGESDGHVWFVMAHVDGESLAARLRHGGPLRPAAVAALLRDVTAALGHAHARGIVHRDIKAENIILDSVSGRPMVTDFGIARLAEAAPLTATGQLLGTVYYLSPEQVGGEAVDARSDIYALGVVAFLALTGRFPFEGDVASAVLVAHVTKAPPPVASLAPHVPAPLAAIVDRCLAKAPDARFASAGALLAALDALVPPAAPASPPALPAARGPLLSDTEAQAVWRRAAELQAATGVHARPVAMPRGRDAARDGARRDGLRVAQVRAAAGEAGIDARWVDHALAEHGLSASGQLLRPAAPRGRAQRLAAWIAGAPLDIVVEHAVAGELAGREYDRILNVLRDGTDTLGTIATRASALRWDTTWPGHALAVSIEPRDGSTTVRLSQSIRGAAAGRAAVALGIIGGIAGPATWVLLNVVLSIPAPSWSVALADGMITAIAAAGGIATALASIPMARWLVRRLRRFHGARLQTLGELVALRVEQGAREDQA